MAGDEVRRARAVLQLEGQRVTSQHADHALVLRTEAGVELRIENDYALTSSRGEVEPATLVGQTISSWEVGWAGRLDVTFDSGVVVVVEPDQHYEAWIVTAPGGFCLVSMPGGELAVWSPG